MTFKLTNEISRDNHLASKAAEAFAACIPLSDIEAEELEALAGLIAAELQDRDYRSRRSAMMQYVKGYFTGNITHIDGEPF